MARTYRLSPQRRLVNRPMRGLLWLGLAPESTYLLTVPGRRTGTLRSTPVTLVEEEDRRWLVAPYGTVSRVRNARAAGRVTLSRGRRSETVGIAELSAEEAAPVLRTYMAQVPITRPYFDPSLEAPAEAFASEAPRHPVFRILGPKAE